MVPEGWNVVMIGELTKSMSAGVSVNSADRPCTNAEFGILKTSSVSDGVFRPERNKLVDEPIEIERLKEPVTADTIVISRMNTPSLVGANGYVSADDPQIFLPDRLWALKTVAKKANCRWLAYWFASGHTRYRISSMATGTSGSMKNITKGDVRSLQVPLPPLPEQRKIADILSTWDRAIETTEALLATARTQKRALMQSLLTGKRRFSEFEGQDWKEVRLGDVVAGKKTKGKIVPTNEDGNGLPYIGATSFDGTFTAFTDSADAVVCHPEDLLVLWDGENAGAVTVGLHGVVSSTVVRFRFDRRRVLASFVRALLEHRNYEVRAVREGSGIPHMPKDFESWFQFALPSLAEQQAIMAAIDASGADVGSIRQQLAKLRTEKKALMQQLLTGKRRVVV